MKGARTGRLARDRAVSVDIRARAIMRASLYGSALALVALGPLACARPTARCPGEVPASSELSEVTERQSYDVEGRSVDELRRALEARGPVAEDGRRYDARTSSELCLATALEAETGRWCRARAIRVQLRTTYVLPRWTTADDAPRDARDWWSTRIARLHAHEQVHRALGVDAARALFARAHAEREAPTCAALEARFEAMLDDVTDQLARRNATVDRLTDHGRRDVAFAELVSGVR